MSESELKKHYKDAEVILCAVHADTITIKKIITSITPSKDI